MLNDIQLAMISATAGTLQGAVKAIIQSLQSLTHGID